MKVEIDEASSSHISSLQKSPGQSKEPPLRRTKVVTKTKTLMDQARENMNAKLNSKNITIPALIENHYSDMLENIEKSLAYLNKQIEANPDYFDNEFRNSHSYVK